MSTSMKSRFNRYADQDARRVAAELSAIYTARGEEPVQRPSVMRRLGDWLHA
jgi:hypothetical protein